MKAIILMVSMAFVLMGCATSNRPGVGAVGNDTETETVSGMGNPNLYATPSGPAVPSGPNGFITPNNPFGVGDGGLTYAW